MAHAIFSPSSASRRVLCRGSMALEFGEPDSRSTYADEGTAAHFVAAEVLRGARTLRSCVGDSVVVPPNGEARWLRPEDSEPSIFEVTEDMARALTDYIESVWVYKDACMTPKGHAELLVETRIPIDHITGEEGATGSADVVIFNMSGDELQVHDLKFGRGVIVDAERNEQMALYALGALEALRGIIDPAIVTMVIHQPNVSGISEWSIPVADLLEFGKTLKQVAAEAFALLHALQETGHLPAHRLSPGEKQCKFCKAKAKCPALAQVIRNAVRNSLAEFPDLPPVTGAFMEAEAAHEAVVADTPDVADLGAAMDAVPLVELWAAAVRGAVESALLGGKPVPGYKLVQGRMGARTWSDESAVRELVKGMRAKRELFYEERFKSPPAMEKLVKDKLLAESQWARIAQHIVQKEGSPSVAPASDKRPALVVGPDASEFDAI